MRDDLHQLTKDVAAWLADAAEIVGTEAVREVQMHFAEEGVDGQPWKKRVPGTPRNDRRLLSDTNTLEDSVRYEVRNGGGEVAVGVNTAIVPYAQIHQEGGDIPITGDRPKRLPGGRRQPASGMRAYFWALYLKTGNDLYKGLALAKGPIKIPARPYLVITPRMVARIEEALDKALGRVNTRVIHTGARGGKYYVARSGRKVYVK